MTDQMIPPGLCQCGCGQKTNIAKKNFTKRGYEPGVPYRFVRGHRRAIHNSPGKPLYLVEERGFQTPCWIWQASVSKATGYGLVDGKGAHKWMYEKSRGQVPRGLHLDHLCRVRLCVNPDHLEPVSTATNTRRGKAARLDITVAREVRALRAAGLTYQAIGERFGIDLSYARKIALGLQWAEDEGEKGIK